MAPALVYGLEVRLTAALGPGFRLVQPDSDAARARFLAEHPEEAAAIRSGAGVQQGFRFAGEEDETAAGDDGEAGDSLEAEA